jgi:hypothetical protein
VHIEKSSRHNVATWNLTTRTLAGNKTQGFTVDGAPLGFYHFTGFDSGAHRVMAQVNAGGNDSVEALISWYEAETENKSGAGNSGPPWAFARYSCGTVIQKSHRAIYRDRHDLRVAFPNPFDSGTGNSGYLGWIKSQGLLEYPDINDDQGRPARLKGALSPMTPITARSGGTAALRVMVPPDADARQLVKLVAQSAGYRRHLRQRIAEIFKAEGVSGVWRRLVQRIHPRARLKVPDGKIA